jgi:hypothetical protein
MYVEPPDSHLIPPGTNLSWTYSISGYDSISKYSSSNGTLTETPIDFPANHGLSYEWDSTGRYWQQIPFVTGYENRCDLGQLMESLIYAPSTEGSENGLLCGFDFLDSGLRYWFYLPNNPVKPLHFTANSIVTVQGGDTASGIYFADLDPTQYSISVPAGTFSAYKLTLRFIGQMGVGDSLYDTDTLYLTAGKGVVKKIKSEIERVQNNPGGPYYEETNYWTMYELE